MSRPLPAGVRAACLLGALEPGAPRPRVEGALVLLGHRASAVDDAAGRGLLRIASGRVDVVGAHVGRAVVAAATERERRTAHLALACAPVAGQSPGRTGFDALCSALDRPAPPPHAVPRVDDRLTPQERHVAGLAATGARTCEIAEAAHLSQKTVEYHLTRIYRKVGVRSKAELAVAFQAPDLVVAGH